MKRVWSALGLVLALTAFMPRASQAQTSSAKKPSITLGQNFPNPFNPETTIPFGLEVTCPEGSRQYRVTLKIFNMLSQLVKVPLLKGSGTPLNNVLLPCGQYQAYWDGKVLDTGREAASGVYYYRIEVDGIVVLSKKMISIK